MARSANRVARFARGLIAVGAVEQESAGFTAGNATLGASEVAALAADGIVALEGRICRATAETRTWLRRQALAPGEFGAQHRIETRKPDGVLLNLAESPLARLASPAGGDDAFLERHHVEAGERVRRLVERAQLQPRVTMSYSAAHVAGGKGGGRRAAEVTDMAAEARRALRELHEVLPRDCAEVVLDVCGLLKGLQAVETERGWPRRSAKLVLRIGLEQLAQHYGFAPEAVGAPSRRARVWLDDGARPTVVG